MTTHPLDALMSPKSIALVGASAKPDSSGYAMVSMCKIDGYNGAIYLVNPRYEAIDDLTCYPDLASLPEVPEHVLIGVASRFVEGILDQVIALGIKAVTIVAACHLDEDNTPNLIERLHKKAKSASVDMCGPNCMGYYNPLAGIRVASFTSPANLQVGGIAWISQSGSAFAALSHNDRRLGFSSCISTGMELITTIADYIDWALAQTQTRVVGLFLETVRDPDHFIKALKQAKERSIPVVVLKVGRTEKSARMALSHTGALAGNDAAYNALFRKYGVIQVSDLDEMTAILSLLDQERRVSDGDLATMHDSGGERELVVDVAEELGVPYAEINEETTKALAVHLEPGLKAENPLDAYGTNADYINRYTSMVQTLVNDPNVALTYFMANPRDGYWFAEGYTEAVIEAAKKTDKPLAIVSNYSMSDDRKLALLLKEHDIPLIRGTRNGLLAAKHAMAWRDFQNQQDDVPISAPSSVINVWKKALSEKGQLSEYEGLQMLNDFGLNAPEMISVSSREEIQDLPKDMSFPLVMKTAEDHAHKSDVGGVVLGLQTSKEVLLAYDKLSEQLGPKVLLMETAPKGIEIGLGAIIDPSFGPVVILAAGGIFIELLNDKIAALAPFGTCEAKRLLLSLKIAPMLKGIRGQEAANIDDLARQISAFSVMVSELKDHLSEIDVNPMMASAKGTWAVDCLAVGA